MSRVVKDQLTGKSMEVKSSKPVEQVEDWDQLLKRADSYRVKCRSEYQRIVAERKEKSAALAEYIRIYPASEKHIGFAAAHADWVERLMSKFLTTTVMPGYDPDADELSFKAPVTIYALKEYIKGKFQDCESQIDKLAEIEPDVKRFVDVCGVLKKIVRLSADDQSLFFMFSACYVKGFELLAAPQVRIGRYFSDNEQKCIESAFREVEELITEFCSSIGCPSGLEVENCANQILKRIEGASPADFWFRLLFDGDRGHAVFNPVYIADYHSRIAFLHNLLKRSSDWDDQFTLVRDEFSGKWLYEQLLPQEEFFANILTNNKYKAEEVLRRNQARDALICATMIGAFEEDWGRITRESDELFGRLNSASEVAEAEKRKCEEMLGSLEEERQTILTLIDIAGYKLEDLLRGEIEVEGGKHVKIRKLQYASAHNDGSPVKKLCAIPETSVETGKPQSKHAPDEGGEASRTQPVKKGGRGRAARIRDEFCKGRLAGEFGVIEVLTGGQTIGWKYNKQSGFCKLSSRPAVLLFQELLRNSVESILEKKQPQSIYITSGLWNCFKKGLKGKNTETAERENVKRFLREVVLKGSKAECSDVQPEQLYLDPQLEDHIGLPVAAKYVYPINLNPTLSAQWVEKGKKKD